MSYSSGLGNLQHLLGNLAANGTGDPKRSELTTGTTQATTASGSADEIGRGSDQTQLSVASGLIGNALLGSDVRTAKVSALQQAIGNGAYSVSADAVAGKMLDAMLR